MSITGTALEQGQLVHLRNRYFIVEDVIPHDTGPVVSPVTRVSLECIDDDRLGESLDVIWEREVNTRILEDISLPAMTDWDKPHEFGRSKKPGIKREYNNIKYDYLIEK